MRKKRVSFWATKRTTKPVRVSFETWEGKSVSFHAKKKITKPVKVTFYVKKRRRS